ncbi:LOW QUALITY PROTEIN: cilia- and flagella-associated protein 107 [Pholidichthys leucotaenia]
MSQKVTAKDKWAQPGRIEQKYASKVLVGNWAERLKHPNPNVTLMANGCQGFYSLVDYRPHWDLKPDVSERRSALLKAEGLPSKMLFTHCGSPSPNYLVTQYEESCGHKSSSVLPSLKPRHPDKLMEQPEKPDRLISANFSPLQSTNHHFEKQQSPLTVYRSAYQRYPLSAFCQSRSAKASCVLSSNIYGANLNNKDLDLRQRSLLQVPDCCLSLFLPSQQAQRQDK